MLPSVLSAAKASCVAYIETTLEFEIDITETELPSPGSYQLIMPPSLFRAAKVSVVEYTAITPDETTTFPYVFNTLPLDFNAATAISVK